jgi:hypothetical protein
MKRSILLFGCLALLGVPGVVKALAINPVTITLDMPNQVVTAPTIGVTELIFTGSVTVQPGWHVTGESVDMPANSSQTNALSAAFDPSFSPVDGGTYIGNLFDVFVPTGTPQDLYAFRILSTNPSMFSVFASQLSQANGAASIDGGISSFTGSAPFSVQVNGPATGVPDQGSTLLLMGVSMAVLELGRRLVRPVLPKI